MSVNVTEPTASARNLPLDTPNPLFLRDEELTRGLELLDFAHRALVAEPERVLAGLSLGRHHQRLIHFIGREPGITMVQLLDLLQLSKQSTSRLLKELVAKGLIAQQPNPRDRRQRLLELTERGRQLDEQLTRRLRRRLASAYRAAGAEAVAGYHKVLLGLVDERVRRHLHGTG
jgi:DNA-binding MarR family transcriptional regulator